MNYGLMSGCLPGSYEHLLRECGKIGFDGALVSEVEPHLATNADTARAIKKIVAGQ